MQWEGVVRGRRGYTLFYDFIIIIIIIIIGHLFALAFVVFFSLIFIISFSGWNQSKI